MSRTPTPASDAYVSVSGRASVVEDDARKKRMWSKFAQAWFPGGPEDPDLALIRVQIEEAEYWNVRESKVTQLFKIARATVTGQPPTASVSTRSCSGGQPARSGARRNSWLAGALRGARILRRYRMLSAQSPRPPESCPS